MMLLGDTAPTRKRYYNDMCAPFACTHIVQMAKAGFVYTPQTPIDDSASCLYCGIVLNGWEHGDDPMSGLLNHASLSTLIQSSQGGTSQARSKVEPYLHFL
jgi:hypothetical protein